MCLGPINPCSLVCGSDSESLWAQFSWFCIFSFDIFWPLWLLQSFFLLFRLIPWASPNVWVCYSSSVTINCCVSPLRRQYTRFLWTLLCPPTKYSLHLFLFGQVKYEGTFLWKSLLIEFWSFSKFNDRTSSKNFLRGRDVKAVTFHSRSHHLGRCKTAFLKS